MVRKKKKTSSRKSPSARSRKIQPSAPMPRARDSSPREPSHRITEAEAPTIVGIGASAGGLEAFTQLLHALQEPTGMAIVLVQHLAAKHESILPHLLGGTTRLPVIQVSDRMRLEPDHVYVIPPNAYMGIQEGKLHLIPRPGDQRQFMPVDFFLRSLAQYAQNRAIGVILSGTASDGAIGLREIKAVGGITVAQQPESAKYDGMPRAAIATGIVDLVLSPQEIAAELVRISRHPYIKHAIPRRLGDTIPVVDAQLFRIFALLRDSSGVDFTQYKQPTIKRRLQRRMVLNKVASIDQYIKLLEQNPDEVKNLYHDILIHVTQFFREPESFELLVRKVFPKIMEARNGESPIRMWVPGCATGEEAYSLAIAMLEFFEDEAGHIPIQVFATDVSETAIEFARAGVYPENITADVSPERLRRFFNGIDGKYRILKRVRDMCILARQDLTRDPPFSKLDLILCRNVMIYLGAQLQRRLITIFHYALKPTGFLMLAAAETIGPYADLFSAFDRKHRIYKKKEATPAAQMDFSAAPSAVYPVTARKMAFEGRTRIAIQEEVDRILLARFAPAGVIVDDDLQIIEFRGQTGHFLEPAAGDASLNLLKMAREGLLYGLRTALHDARKRGGPVAKSGLKVKVDSHWRDVNLDVIPLLKAGDSPHFLVLFQEATASIGAKASPAQRQKTEPAPGKPYKGSRIAELEKELAASREYLQSIIQDLEAANEELQSANEEILSSNEELQSTNEELDTAKEELQSTNEELNTLNEELHGRNEELGQVNSDLVNLLTSVQIAIVIVSNDLKIRRFTPMAERVLNLIPSDIGRPISHIKPNIQCPDLERSITQVIDTVTVTEREVQDSQGNSFSLRIRPYKSTENRIEGAVLALFDVDAAKRYETELHNAREHAEAILDAVRKPFLVLDRDLRVKEANEAFCKLFGVTPQETANRFIDEVGNGKWNVVRLHELLQEVLEKGSDFEDIELDDSLSALGRQRIFVDARRIRGEGDGRPLILLAMAAVGAPPMSSA
jgi:two-component system, chemotaxis family, CheB/CheR fusion protein